MKVPSEVVILSPSDLQISAVMSSVECPAENPTGLQRSAVTESVGAHAVVHYESKGRKTVEDTFTVLRPSSRLPVEAIQ